MDITRSTDALPRTQDPRWRLHASVRLLIAVEMVAIVALTAKSELALAELALLLVAAIFRRVKFQILVVSMLMCIALSALLILTPVNHGRILAHAQGLALPLAWRQVIETMLVAMGVFTPPPLLVGFFVGAAKVACIGLIMVVFATLIPTTDLLDLFSSASNVIPGTRSTLYLVSTTLAALPTIQSDVRNSLDAVIVRGGGRRSLLAPTAWDIVLTDVLVRAVERSHRLANEAITRGFRLRTGLTALPKQRFGVRDAALTALALLIGALIVEVLL